MMLPEVAERQILAYLGLERRHRCWAAKNDGRTCQRKSRRDDLFCCQHRLLLNSRMAESISGNLHHLDNLILVLEALKKALASQKKREKAAEDERRRRRAAWRTRLVHVFTAPLDRYPSPSWRARLPFRQPFY